MAFDVLFETIGDAELACAIGCRHAADTFGRVTQPRDSPARFGSRIYLRKHDPLGAEIEHTVGALAIVAHEIGHAMQDEEDYGPMRVRSALVRPVNVFPRWHLLRFGGDGASGPGPR